MTKETLEKNGTKILEHDRYDGGIYLGTNSLHLLDGNIFEYTYNDNRMRYTGKKHDIFCLGTREDFFNHNWDLFFACDLTAEGQKILTSAEIDRLR